MEAKKLRIVYMGTPDFAVSPLAKLVEEGYNVVGVVTMPDKPSGRGLHVQQSAVKRYALQAGLPVYQPEKLRDPAFVETFRSMKPDLGIVIAFRMLPEIIWAAPKIFKETCRIDWRQPAARICNLIRGLSPYPAAWSELSRPDATPVGVKIFRAKAEACRPGKAPGAIVTDGRSEIKVACADGYVQIEELQIAGRRRMTTEELLRGFKEIESCTFR